MKGILTLSMNFGMYLQIIYVYLESVQKKIAQTGTLLTIKLYKKDKEVTFKYQQGITSITGKFESLEDITQKSKI